MDDVLTALVRDAEADPETVAVILRGSRFVGHERPDSDYDVYFR
jgi:predicted nucleotidyltransferase